MAAPAVSSRLERGARATSMMGAALLDGWIACSTAPRAAVAALLPPMLRLAAKPPAPSDRHPVVCICGTVKETTILFGGLTIPTGVSYRELAIIAPFVRRRGSRDTYAFVLRMCSTVPLAVHVGNVYYGFAKALAAIGDHSPQWLVTAPDGTLLAQAMLDERGSWARGRHSPARALARAGEALSLPLLGCKVGGSLVRSHFDWRFDAALVRPAAAWVGLADPLIAGLSLHDDEGQFNNALMVRDLAWRLSWPAAESART